MVSLEWSGKGIQFMARDDQGHEIIVDTVKEQGGLDQGIAPMNLLLVAMAGCMGMDIVAILKKKGYHPNSARVQMEGEKSATHPHRFLRIQYRIDVQGDQPREELLRAFELSRDRYCSVLATLKNTPEVEFTV